MLATRLIKILTNYNYFYCRYIICIYCVLTIIACSSDKEQPVNVDQITLEIKINRFEKDLMNLDLLNIDSSLKQLSRKHPVFFPLFIENILKLGKMEDNFYQPQLQGFLKYEGTQELLKDCDAKYADIEDIERDLTRAFKYFKYYFPEKPVPEIITFASEYIYANVTSDSLLGIGLDLYLGNTYPTYAQISIPQYKYHKYRREYIVPNAVKAFAHSRYPETEITTKQCLSKMIYMGKILYFMDRLLPDVPDSIKIGYTPRQLEWCINSESSLWAYFVDKKLLFSTDHNEYTRYFVEAPFTTGLPRESAPMLGAWIGWQIVKEYMNKNLVSSLPELMNDPDFSGQSILNKSKYKPKR